MSKPYGRTVLTVASIFTWTMLDPVFEILSRTMNSSANRFFQAISPAGPSVWSLPELVTTKPGKPKPPKKINIDEVGTSEGKFDY